MAAAQAPRTSLNPKALWPPLLSWPSSGGQEESPGSNAQPEEGPQAGCGGRGPESLHCRGRRPGAQAPWVVVCPRLGALGRGQGP